MTDSTLQSSKFYYFTKNAYDFFRKRFGLFSFKTPVAVCDTLPEKPLRYIAF